ncbi:MAG TPA: hypothetical protein VGS19_34595 [Streptosporangiaceae bacterium]|nr:hypothetical protein [Streptosporangiaceae bacterium]
MTAAGVHESAPQAAHAPIAGHPVTAGARLAWLYLTSRRAPAAAGLLAALGAVLWAALYWHWNIAGGRAAQLFIPLVIETGIAAVIVVTTYGPFGDPERATGRWLPWLRLGAPVVLTAAGVGALAAGASAGLMPGGSLAWVRNLAGMVGVGLLCAVVLGGAFAWAAPMAYLIVSEGALVRGWTTPWAWAARPPHDFGGALCAAVVFAGGLAAFTLLGARDSGRLAVRE